MDVNKKKQGEGSNQGATPLFIAARYGHEAVVKALLADCRIDPKGGKRSDGSTPLTVATHEGHDLHHSRRLHQSRVLLCLAVHLSMAFDVG